MHDRIVNPEQEDDNEPPWNSRETITCHSVIAGGVGGGGGGTCLASTSSGSLTYVGGGVEFYSTSTPFFSGFLGSTNAAVHQALMHAHHLLISQQQMVLANAFNNGLALLQSQQYQEPKLETEIKAGEIIAWRMWRLSRGYLQSASMDTIWKPGIIMEGDVKTGVGVHAWKTADAAIKYSEQWSGTRAIGEVELWGEVIEHEVGYRAQYAAVKRIDSLVGPRWPWQLFILRNRYKLLAA